MSALKEFLSKHQLQVGDWVELQWKGLSMKGMVLPQSSDNGVLEVKLSSGYNTGMGIASIQSIQKIQVENKTAASNYIDAPAPVASSAKKSMTGYMDSAATTKPQISIIRSGGTIGSRVDYKKAGVSPLLTPEEMLRLVPEINAFASISSIQSPFSKLSENMIPDDWIRLAHACAEELKKKEIRGILLTHGTDTLHYTAAALSFFLRNLNKPIVLVGSQRSSDRGSTDANMNLICASRIALSDIAEVGICMHGTSSDDYCLFNRGTKVRKMHTSRRDAFRPINSKSLAKVWPDGKIETLIPFRSRSENKKLELDAVFEENIALIKVYPGMQPQVLEHYVQNGCKGFIIEGTGLGHVPENWSPFIAKLSAKGIPIFSTSQAPYGRTNLNVYSAGRVTQEAGLVGLEDMLPEVAYVKLGWVLAHTQKLEEVRKMMLTDYAGELTTRTEEDTFLY